MSAKSLMAKLLKANKKDENVSVLADTGLLDKNVICSTTVPMIDVAWSGRPDGGIIPGIKMLVGDSRTFKTNFGLLDVKAYLDEFPDACCVFADSEFGANQKYWESFGIDTNRVLHLPVVDVEMMKKRLAQTLTALDPEDKVIVFIDSVSQLPSRKEAEDALTDKEAQDMTRARALNSFWRVITPIVNLHKWPLVWINSYYDSIGDKYAEKNIKGGKQGFLSSDAIWFITRSQEKGSDKELIGWNFNINIMKGRFVREKAKIPVTVLYDQGIYRWSGMLEVCRYLGLIDMPTNGWYCVNEKAGFTEAGKKKGELKKRQKKDLDDDFWYAMMEQPNVIDAIAAFYSVSTGTLLSTPETERGMEKISEMATE